MAMNSEQLEQATVLTLLLKVAILHTSIGKRPTCVCFVTTDA